MTLTKHIQHTALVATGLLLISASQAFAQVRLQGVVIGTGDTSRHKSSNSEQMLVFLEMYIEDMQTVTSLSDAQVKKLSLAGNSVVQKLLSTEDMEATKKRINGELLPDKAPEVEKDSLSDEDAEPKKKAEKKQRPNVSLKKQVSLNQVTSDSLWKKATQSILSEEQHDTWTQAQTERKKRTLEALVNRRVTELAEQVFLRPDQLPAVAEVIQRVEGDQLLKDFHAGGSNPFLMARRGRSRTQVSENHLKDVLTPVQLKVWKALKSPTNGRRRGIR